MKQQSHQPQQEDSNVRPIWQESTSFWIAARLGDLSEPDGGVNCQGLMGERLDGDAASDGEEEAPEVFNSHGVKRDAKC